MKRGRRGSIQPNGRSSQHRSSPLKETSTAISRPTFPLPSGGPAAPSCSAFICIRAVSKARVVMHCWQVAVPCNICSPSVDREPGLSCDAIFDSSFYNLGNVPRNSPLSSSFGICISLPHLGGSISIIAYELATRRLRSAPSRSTQS